MPTVDKSGRIRGYAFIEPGKKSRYIPLRRRKTVYKKKSVPTRLRYSRTNYRKNSQIANTLSMFSEKKYSALNDQDEVAPDQISVGSITYWKGYCCGQVTPATWTSGVGSWLPLDGFRYAPGTGNNSRDGRFMFLNGTTINCDIHMNQQTRNTPPVEFRMICFKARRATTPTGVSYDPSQTLFLAPNGSVQGHQTMLGNDLMLQPLNKRDWIILNDKRFTLQAPMGISSESSSFQGKYLSYKRIRLIFNHKIKSAFALNNEPEDYDYRFGIVIYASAIGRDAQANTWEFNLRGTTTAYDN